MKIDIKNITLEQKYWLAVTGWLVLGWILTSMEHPPHRWAFIALTLVFSGVILMGLGIVNYSEGVFSRDKRQRKQ
jgi:hypothetical protein